MNDLAQLVALDERNVRAGYAPEVVEFYDAQFGTEQDKPTEEPAANTMLNAEDYF